MANSNESGQCTEFTELFCDPCKNDGQTLSVEGFCVDCEEYLCKDCYKVHCRPSMTRHHVLQEKQDMPRKQAFKPDTCSIHTDQPIEYYCEKHEEVCCSVCRISSHEKCEDVKGINEIVTKIDMKKEFAKLQCNTKLLKNDIGKTQYMVQTSYKAIAANHDKARGAMDTLRKRVREHIDKIESELDKKLKTVRDEDEGKITTHKNTCEAMNFDAKTLKSYVQAKISTNRKHDAFIAMKRAHSKIKINHVNLEKIRMENKVRRYIFEPNNQVEMLTMNLCSFGKLSYKDKEIKSTQFITDLNVRHTKDSIECEITGLCFISESHVAAADKGNKNVKIIDINLNKITADISFSFPPYDITVVPDNKLAVTIPEGKMIQFLSVALPKADAVNLEKIVNVSGKCQGIDFIRSEGKIIVTYCNPGKVEILNLHGIVDRIVDVEFHNPTKISVIPSTNIACISEMRDKHNGKMMLVDFGDQKKEVIEISKYDNRFQIPKVHGITNDKLGVFNYLCTDDKVFVMSLDNMKLETVLGSQYDEVQYARSIVFCDRTFRIYIGQKGDKIKVYIVA